LLEIIEPTGFLILQEPINFKVEGIRDYDKDSDGDYIKTIEVFNEQPTATIIIDKSILLRDDVNTSLIDTSDYSKIQFKLTAKEDIIDRADNSVIYSAGTEIGIYNLSKEGNLKIEGLPLGIYELQEVSIIPGLVLKDTIYTVEFILKDNTTKVYTETLEIENETTIFEFSKKSITGEDELIDAKLKVLDEENNIVDSWTSTDKPHKIEGLEAGKTFKLVEEIAPNGYVIANEIEFTVSSTNEIQKVTMIDKIVEVQKIDIDGNPVENSTLQVLDKDMNIIDEWTTSNEAYRVSGLREGEIYILHEEVVAEGFVKATDIEFEVSYDKETQVIEMIDKVVEIIKLDVYGNPVENSTLTVLDEENNVVDEWVTTKESHRVCNLEENKKYTLVEKNVAEGYVKASNIEFTVNDDKATQTIEMVDKIVEIIKLDVDKSPVVNSTLQVLDEERNIIDEWITTNEPYRVKNLEENRKYILSEKIVAEGYVKACDIEFEVTTNKENQKIEMIDKIVEVLKVDVDGNPVVNSTLQVLDEKRNVIDEWITTNEPYRVKNLEENKKYILSEKIVAEGYVKASDIEFEVTTDKENQIVQMIDKIVEISKIDIAGEEIPGATLQVKDLEENIIDEWVSEEIPHKVRGLQEGVTYILHEEITVDGYVQATDIEFTVTYDKENQKIEMIDKVVEISKVDIAGEEIEGATLQVLDKEDNIVDEWISGKIPHKVKGLKENETYRLHEELVVDGYVKATDIEFTVTLDKETQKIEMIDKIVLISKIDKITGEMIADCHLKIIDEENNVVDSWISTKEPHQVVGLEENKKYCLVEDEAKYGFSIAEPIEFVVTEDKQTQEIVMEDMPILKTIRVLKIDSETKEIIKDKFVFGLYEDEACTKLIKKVKSNKALGTVLFEDIRYGTVYLKELSAPKGYQLSDKVVKIEINDEGTFADGELLEDDNSVCTLTYENKLIPKVQTGNEIDYAILFGSIIISLLGAIIGIVILIRKNKKNK